MASSVPSTTAYAVAGVIVGLTVGYFLGQASTAGVLGSNSSKRRSTPRKSWPNNYDVQIHPDSSDEELMQHLRGGSLPEPGSDSDSDDAGAAAGELQAFKDNTEECKLVLVVRTDLGMGKGKIAAQCSHATLACYNHFLTHAPQSPLLGRWRALGQAKVAVQCKSEDELLTLQALALSLGLCARIIRDAGRTQIASGSTTVLGIGPAPKSLVDQVTGSLKLL